MSVMGTEVFGVFVLYIVIHVCDIFRTILSLLQGKFSFWYLALALGDHSSVILFVLCDAYEFV